MAQNSPLPKNVLVVEDNEATREAFALILGCEGYQVETADNGRRALEHLRSHARPCVIVLDLMMPEMDGWQFREEQRRDALLADIPVIVCSASGESLNGRAAALEGAEYLKKPIEPRALLESVRRYC
jgi:CheY-like chemotaxis protein